MNYRIKYTDEAKRALHTLPGRYRQRARRIIEGLAIDPRPATAKELRDRPGRFRVRLNGWRIIYRVDDEEQVVTILAIRIKKGPETYHNLESEK
ncbi:MAG: type II toxin-antitoxin system RelE/ParE family toxin [Candidatus Tectomicrobia bacterium]|uniref:Type II toxin-antitoxin system RelE/ParE family toxin n=1 Tax=Tectimicrobiota bacterium TaxID=2528274 RepID=A0A932CNH2_UNCTE|nr:type II toxin-antitoxin system RelE/ParE family toxin [Candidatus Tectomicrobia bacterium]